MIVEQIDTHTKRITYEHATELSDSDLVYQLMLHLDKAPKYAYVLGEPEDKVIRVFQPTLKFTEAEIRVAATQRGLDIEKEMAERLELIDIWYPEALEKARKQGLEPAEGEEEVEDGV